MFPIHVRVCVFVDANVRFAELTGVVCGFVRQIVEYVECKYTHALTLFE